MSAGELPPPPVSQGLGAVHLALAAVGSSALTGLILVFSLAGRSERLGGEVERSVRRGIEGGVEQALAPDRVRDTSAAAGRGLVGGLVDGAFDQVSGGGADALLGVGEQVAAGALDFGLDAGLETMDALTGPIEPRAERSVEPRANGVASVDSTAPKGARRGLAREAGAFTAEALDLGLDVMEDVLGVSPREHVAQPEDVRDARDR